LINPIFWSMTIYYIFTESSVIQHSSPHRFITAVWLHDIWQPGVVLPAAGGLLQDRGLEVSSHDVFSTFLVGFQFPCLAVDVYRDNPTLDQISLE